MIIDIKSFVVKWYTELYLIQNHLDVCMAYFLELSMLWKVAHQLPGTNMESDNYFS